MKEVLEISQQKKGCQCPKIIIVDDNSLNIMALGMMLETFGLRSDTAIQGAKCLEQIRYRMNSAHCKECQMYKLIFMDLNMPVMDGYEATKHIRNMVDKGIISEITIVAHTAFVHGTEIEGIYKAGMHEYLQKPVQRQILIDILKKYNLIHY